MVSAVLGLGALAVRGSFGHEAGGTAAVMPGNATRAAALLGACALSAAAGFALGGLLGARNGSDWGRIETSRRR